MKKWVNKKLDDWAEKRIYNNLKKKEYGRHWQAFAYLIIHKTNILEGTLKVQEENVYIPKDSTEVPYQKVLVSFDCISSGLLDDFVQIIKSEGNLSEISKSKHTFRNDYLTLYKEMYGSEIELEECKKLFNLIGEKYDGE